MYNRLPPLAAGCILSILIADRGLSVLHWILLVVSLLWILAPGVVWMGRRHRPGRWRPVLQGLQLIGIGMFVGGLVSFSAVYRYERAHLGIPGESVKNIVVVLTEDPRILPNNRWTARAILREVDGGPMGAESRGPVVVDGHGRGFDFAAGALIRLEGRVFRRSSDRRVSSTPFRVAGNVETPIGWICPVAQRRMDGIRTLRSRLKTLPVDSASMLEALLLGRSSDPGSPIRRAYKEAGCLHLLALSGFHVGFVVLAVSLLTRPVIGKNGSIMAGLVAAVFYLGIAGFRPSLTRAVIMYAAWSFDAIRKKSAAPWGYLSLAALIQTGANPASVSTISFQLSYLALAGILGTGRHLTAFLKVALPGNAAAALGASLGAQVATFPVVFSRFGIWRPSGILSTLVLTPLTTVTMGAGTVFLLFPSLPILPKAVELVASLQLSLASPFSRVPALVGVKSITSTVAVLGWFAALVGAILPAIAIRRRTREKTAANPELRLPCLDPRLPGSAGLGAA